MSDLAALTARIEKLEHELAIQQDIHQIRRVQYTYGYFIDKSQYNEVVDLFADDGDVWFLGGIYRGKAGGRRCTSNAFRSISLRATMGGVCASQSPQSGLGLHWAAQSPSHPRDACVAPVSQRCP